ncbi:S-layer homology domain-containing protein [Oscillospiraceae bacterium OttesenSCG-928-G22]|nr:S-layer homology domain-containing protein [Oscillospiraceae bacterium OttesenSCG-928-G22]
MGVSNTAIAGCSATGAVTVGDSEDLVDQCAYAGGLAGISHGDITDSYATGAVTGGYAAYVGGLAAYNASGKSITGCYATGAVTGGNEAIAGGLVAFNGGGIITNCYATGVVTGGNVAIAGGLVAFNGGGIITNCYATGDATGGAGAKVGGFVGTTGGAVTGLYDIDNCYAAGNVAGGAGALVGGFAGQINSNTVSSYMKRYWNTTATQTVDGAARSDAQKLAVGGGTIAGDPNITGKTLAEMRSAAFADELTLHIAGLPDAQRMAVGYWRWFFSEGETPYLLFVDLFHDGNGDGSEGNPYVIKFEDQLRTMAGLVNTGADFAGKHFRLANSIALSQEWAPIGGFFDPYSCYFSGSFDGGGHSITGIRIGTAENPSPLNNVGLFGIIGPGGEVKNLGVESAGIYGGANSAIGILASNNDGVITNCYASGNVTGGADASVGGLVGHSSDTITNCYATVNVTGSASASVGGLVGYSSGPLTNCYATGSVTGGAAASVGGLAGFSSANITKGYWNTDTVRLAVGRVDAISVAATGMRFNEMATETFAAKLSEYVTGQGGAPLKTWTRDTTHNQGLPYLDGVKPTDDPYVAPIIIGGGGGGSTPPVTVVKPDNGTITATPTNPKQGDTVTVTVTPKEGYEAKGITVTDKNGKELPVTDNGDGTYSFKYGGLPVTIEAAFTPKAESWANPFTDVKENDWFYSHVKYVYENGLMQGIAEDKFGAGLPMSRAMLITVLYRIVGEPNVDGQDNPFSDVESGQWYTDAVLWAEANGITTGYGDGVFGTDDEVTREDMCVLLVRFLNFMGIELPVERDAFDFADASKISGYAREAVMLLYRAGIIEGKGDGVFDPQGSATRAELATMLHRFLEATRLEL